MTNTRALVCAVLLASSFCFGVRSACAQQPDAPFNPAKDRTDADIYLAGSLTSASNADTVYAWDIKFAYPKLARPIDDRKNHWLYVSPRLEFTANKGTNTNADRIVLAGETEMVIATPKAFGGNLPFLSWFNAAAGEFDRDRVTKTFIYQTFTRLAFRTYTPQCCDPQPPDECSCDYVGFVPRVDLGFEVGKNLENKLQEEGSGNVSRLYFGTTGFYEMGSKYLRITYAYQVRKPLSDEIFSRTPKGGQAVLTLDQKARHYFEIAPVIQIGDWMSIKPTFKRGSLPPAFTYIDKEFSLSIVFAAKAVLR